MTEIRAVTSASNFFRRRLCLGSGNEEAKYGPEPDTEYSEDGKLLHRYFLTLMEEWPAEMTQPQREVLSLANSYAQKFIDDVILHESLEAEAYETDREVFLTFSDKGKELMPGHADLILTFAGASVRILIDAKFGVLEVDSAADNDQLSIYACMAQQRWPVNRTYIAIVQPRNFGPRITSAFYDRVAINAASISIARDFYRSQNEGLLTPGPRQCHFCRAKVKCPAYLSTFSALYVPAGRAIEQCSDEEIVSLHEACQFASKIREQVSIEMRYRIHAGRITTHVLGNSGDDREVIDATGMFQAFASHFAGYPGWSALRYDACRKMSWEKLETYVRELTGLSEKKVKTLIDEISAPFVQRTAKQKKILKLK
jgi:hypothetical protein